MKVRLPVTAAEQQLRARLMTLEQSAEHVAAARRH
jgi:hypothetical protein